MDTSETPTDQRPTWACLLHRPPAEGSTWAASDPGYRSCSPCLDRLRERLAEVADRYARLDSTPGASGGNGGRGAPGFGSRSPASEHVIAMTDARSSIVAKVWVGRDGRVHNEAERPPLSIPAQLETLAVEVAEHRGVEFPSPSRGAPAPIWLRCDLDWQDGRPVPVGGWPRVRLVWRRDRLVQAPAEAAPAPAGPPTAVDVFCRWLDTQLDYVTRHAELALEADAVVRRLLAHLRPVSGDPRPHYIGDCPNVLTGADEVQRLCGRRLYAPAKGDTIACRDPECGRKWPRAEWMRLGAELRQAA